jgi:two-component system chemotaxis response regulator CheY
MAKPNAGCENPAMGVTVLIVDDDEGFRAVARRLLESGGLRVIGEAGDIASALAAVQTLHPRVVLLDVQLPDGDGIAAAEAIRQAEGSDVVLVSNRAESTYGSRVTESAARGFILKPDLTPGGVLALLVGPG